jgi:hypothetical protein
MRPKRWLYNLALASIAGFGANFFLFGIIAISIGGNTWYGKREGDRYYLELKGKYTEVSPALWTYSRLHGLSVFVTAALIPIGAAYATWYEKRAPAAAQSADATDRAGV